MKSTISFYFTIFLRRIHYFLFVFLIIFATSMTLAKILPAVYMSRTSLLVESSQIPNQLAAPTVQTGDAEELQIIEQRLMTRVHLLDIARSENVFEDMGAMAADDIVRKMRANTTIRRSSGRTQATLMNISFKSRSGTIAVNVVNQYVTLVLQNNAETRADRASDTLRFFEIEVERLSKKLEDQGALVLEFNNANADALPNTLTYRLNQQTGLQTRLATVDRDTATLQEQKRRLIEVFEATGNVGNASNANLTPEQRQLVTLQDNLSKALAIYSPEHPKVKVLEAQVTQQKDVVAGQSATAGIDLQSPTSMLDVTVAGIDAQIGLLSEQRVLIIDQLAILEDSLARTPENTILQSALNRDYNNIQNQYNTAVNRMSQAAAAERIELLAKGRRIAILDPATAPNRPTSPNRMLIRIGGTFLGLFLGLALVFMLEFLNSAIRRPTEITKHLGITPIATIPYIRTPMELVVRRATFVSVFALIIIGIPAALFAIHTYYLPLDLIYDQMAAKVRALI